MNMLNEKVGLRVFEDYHPDITSEDFSDAPELKTNNDPGGMRDDIADNYSGLRRAAMAQHFERHIHWKTKNKSFLDLHRDLKALGVKNNKFFLTLYDKTLENVDPFAIVVPPELQARIVREIIINPWYYLREIARIPVDGKPICPGGGSEFLIDRNSVATWYLFLNGFDTYASKPRQCGKTQDALQKINYAYNFGALSSTILLSNKDLNLNKMNLARLKAQRDMLPLWLQAKIVFDVDSRKILKETSNVTSMQNPITKNKVLLLPTANSEAKADGLGRGYTAPLQLWDEFDWTPFNTKIIDCSVFAYNTASDNAKANKSLYGRLFTSTPGNVDSRDGQTAEAFIKGDAETGSKGMLVWEDKMFDMEISKLWQIAHSKSYNGIVFVEHTWKQLKKSNAWYEKACQGVRYNPEVIAREINLLRLRGTTRSPFKRTDIMYLINNVLEPKESVDYSENLSPIRIYGPINKRTSYILSIDPAEGLSGDNMAMVLINPYTEKPVAEFESPYITQPKMGQLVVKFMDTFCPKAVIVVENNKGRELLHWLLESRYANNVWYDNEKMDAKESVNADTPDTSEEKALGFNTNRTTRAMMMKILEDLVIEEPEKVCTKILVDSVCSLERRVSGRIEAAPGKHDDMVMAYLIGICVHRNATNLEDWGIAPGTRDPAEHFERPQTPQDIVAKLKELAELLPANMRSQFIREDKDPATDAANYQKQIQSELARINLQENERKALIDPDYDLIPTAGYDNNAFDNALDKDLDDMINYNGDSKFDINDWL